MEHYQELGEIIRGSYASDNTFVMGHGSLWGHYQKRLKCAVRNSVDKAKRKENSSNGTESADTVLYMLCCIYSINSGVIKNRTDRYIPILYVNPVKEPQLLRF